MARAVGSWSVKFVIVGMKIQWPGSFWINELGIKIRLVINNESKGISHKKNLKEVKPEAELYNYGLFAEPLLIIA